MQNNTSPQTRAEQLCDKLTTEQQAEQLRYDAPAAPEIGLPAYNWWNEGLHGVARAGTATVFPQAIGLAATFDTELLHRIGEAVSTEARAKYNAAAKHADRDIYKGLTLWSPNINIFRDPRWGRGHETYGEDPFLTAQLGVQFVKGLQGEGEFLRTAACAKHFAVHSGPEASRHEFDARPTPRDMEETYLPAFKALVQKAEVEGVMGAYNRVNGEPACASSYLMGKLREWGFDGYFVSDCWAIQDFHLHHHITESYEQSAALALKQGCNVNCGVTYTKILSAMEQGLVTAEDVRKNCVAALRTRIRLGQLDSTEYDSIPYSAVSCPDHKQTALEAALKSAVLLKNNGILPLKNDERLTLAVIGPNADSRAALVGNYNGTPDRYVTFLEGIQDSFNGRVIYASGCHLFSDRTEGLAQAGDRYAEAVAAAENADIVIACIGLDASLEGEEGDTGNAYASGDKPDLYLPECQRELMRRLKATGKPIVAVLAAGSSINIETDTDALINMWYAGQNGGAALAKLIFGEVSPSGKLPVTFYKDSDRLPAFEDYGMDGRTYRYCDKDNVLYPFGYGLSYGGFEVEGLRYKNGVAYVTVRNNGKAAEDVVQLYIKSASGVKHHSLCGFARVNLGENWRTEIAIPLIKSAFETVDENGVRAVRDKSFTLYAGTSQPDALSEQLTGKKCVSTEISEVSI